MLKIAGYMIQMDLFIIKVSTICFVSVFPMDLAGEECTGIIWSVKTW